MQSHIFSFKLLGFTQQILKNSLFLSYSVYAVLVTYERFFPITLLWKNITLLLCARVCFYGRLLTEVVLP